MESVILKFICSNQGAVNTDYLMFNLGLGDSILLQLQPELWKTLSVASFISHLIDRPDPTLEHEAATPSSDLPLNPRKIVNAPSPSQFVFPSLSLYPTCEHISISRS